MGYDTNCNDHACVFGTPIVSGLPQDQVHIIRMCMLDANGTQEDLIAIAHTVTNGYENSCKFESKSLVVILPCTPRHGRPREHDGLPRQWWQHRFKSAACDIQSDRRTFIVGVERSCCSVRDKLCRALELFQHDSLCLHWLELLQGSGPSLLHSRLFWLFQNAAVKEVASVGRKLSSGVKLNFAGNRLWFSSRVSILLASTWITFAGCALLLILGLLVTCARQYKFSSDLTAQTVAEIIVQSSDYPGLLVKSAVALNKVDLLSGSP